MEKIVERHFGPVLSKVPGVVVAMVNGGDEQVFALGTVAARRRPREDQWEIGSITKVFTGTLLAEMSLRGEVRLQDHIGLYLPTEVAERLPLPDLQPTLEDLATHHGGFPSVPAAWLARLWRSDDPYARLSEAMVFDRLGPKTKRPTKPKFRYSNFGMGLLGHLLENVAGQPLKTLMRERLFDPLGLDHTEMGGDHSDVVPGFRKGKVTPPWTFGALAGCGAMRSTVTDLISFARSVADPSSGRVGKALRLATEPRRDGPARDMRIGLGWLTRTDDEGRALWHNGGTYATSSFFAVDPDCSAAVIALGTAGPGLIPRLDAPSWALFDEIRG